MSKSPQIYHGEWWVPAKADPSNSIFMTLPEGAEKKYTGTLTYYGDEDSTLELYHVPSNFHSSHYHHNDVMWGKDANGNIFTLFNVEIKKHTWGDFTTTKFVVGLILIGEHILSINERWIKKCRVWFPHLNNWLFYETKKYIAPLYNNEYHLDASIREIKLLEAEVENGMFWRLYHHMTVAESIEGIAINKTPYFEIRATEPIPLKSYIRQIKEFTQFLSIALFGIQDPQNVEFVIEGDNNTRKLLFKKEVSYDPGFRSLIKLKELKVKLPSMLQLWHSNFEEVAPISHYLINSLKNNNRFDIPDFLIIAQALDGYHKRFINKKDGKNIKKYEDQINVLLNQFNDIEAIRKCNINAKVLTDSRHKYSHLFPDEEKSLAVEGEDLYWLTEKCKILLTCCILNMLGLTNEEINLCCEQSPISQIIDSLPFEPENEYRL